MFSKKYNKTIKLQLQCAQESIVFSNHLLANCMLKRTEAMGRGWGSMQT